VPELPEVETIVRELNRIILGRTVIQAKLIRRDLLKRAAFKDGGFDTFFAGRRFRSVERRGKYLLFNLDNDAAMVAHLGMTGKFIVCERGDPDPDHLCSRYVFKDGGRLDHVDVRRFGRLELYDSSEVIPVLGRLGTDPLSPKFGAESLKSLVTTGDGRKRRRQAVHSALLDQRLISGVGNIYACEALFRAGIRPQRKAGGLTHGEVQRLAESLRRVMLEALDHGGTTVNDYRRVDDKPGDFRRFLRVYNRAGEPCLVCGAAIQRVRLNGRSAYFCPQCQKGKRS
jgi:formamidopyrimidine-DNA glycosylase